MAFIQNVKHLQVLHVFVANVCEWSFFSGVLQVFHLLFLALFCSQKKLFTSVAVAVTTIILVSLSCQSDELFTSALQCLARHE